MGKTVNISRWEGWGSVRNMTINNKEESLLSCNLYSSRGRQIIKFKTSFILNAIVENKEKKKDEMCGDGRYNFK